MQLKYDMNEFRRTEKIAFNPLPNKPWFYMFVEQVF